MRRWNNRIRRRLTGGVRVWHHDDYRLPITSLRSRTGVEPRRADLALWYLLDERAIQPRDMYLPALVPWDDLARVHPYTFLETLNDVAVLARIFAVDEWDIPVEQVLRTLRLACGGTLAATRVALKKDATTLNLLGGFHHAGRESAGGFCALNDIAVAVRAIQSDGFNEVIAILDLDAHPPDGLADCLAGDVWIGSLSGADWGPLEGVDETVLPPDTSDAVYLEALDALLQRMPKAALTFVIAGGDPREEDTLGPLALSEAGLRERDRRVIQRIRGTPSVWLPGGGYGSGSWRPLAMTGLVLAVNRPPDIPPHIDPLYSRFRNLSDSFQQGELTDNNWLTEDDLSDLFGQPRARNKRVLGYYTRQGIELALFRYGMLSQVARLGYRDVRVEVDEPTLGARIRVTGEAMGVRHTLVETVVEKRQLEEAPEVGAVLFIHWLTLRHPRAVFSAARPKLPGQEVPGLGMAREASEMLQRMAARLKLPAVALRPAYYHVAYASRYRFQFLPPARQGRFEAMLRDLSDRSLLAVTVAVSEGRVDLNGSPYAWEADEMIDWLSKEDHPMMSAPERLAQIEAAKGASRFTLRET